MAGITDLGIASIRDGFRAGDFSAREVADAFNTAVAGAKALMFYIVETPDHAIAAAEQADRDRSEGTLKPLSGVPIGMNTFSLTRGVQTTAASHILEGFKPEYELTVSASIGRRARACSASSTWTSSRWAPPTRPARSAM